MNISNHGDFSFPIISYQAITGNNNYDKEHSDELAIISYQAITGNNICSVEIINYRSRNVLKNMFSELYIVFKVMIDL